MALSVALFFWLNNCQTQHEQLHQLMQAGSTNNRWGYDTLYFTDSLFPVVTVETENSKQRWLIDLSLPCLSTTVTHTTVQLPLINAAGDTLSRSFGYMPPLRIGNSVFEGIGSGLLTSAAQALLERQNIQGVIGANLMQHGAWHFDWEQNCVIVAPSPEKFISLPQTIAIPFNRNIYRSPKWQLQFNRFPYRLVLQPSTGFAGGVLMDAEFSANYKSFMYDRLLQTIAFPESIHGISSGQGLYMDSLQIEQLYNFDNLPVIRSKSSYALLGLTFLHRYNFTVDWRQRMIWLHPRLQPNQRGSIKSQRLP